LRLSALTAKMFLQPRRGYVWVSGVWAGCWDCRLHPGYFGYRADMLDTTESVYAFVAEGDGRWVKDNTMAVRRQLRRIATEKCVI
jgi:hypothetical protein